MKTFSIDNIKDIPQFWFEGNQLFTMIDSKEKFNLMIETYPDWKEAKINPNSKNREWKDFGFRSEHSGDETLENYINSFKK